MGAQPLRASPRLYSPPPKKGVPWGEPKLRARPHPRCPSVLAPRPMAPCRGGDTLARRHRREWMFTPGCSLWCPPRMPPPALGARLRTTLGGCSESPVSRVFVVICTDFYRFFRFVVPEYSHMTISLYDHCFFSGFVLWRNYFINRGALVEESSILLLLRRLEAC